MGVDHVCAAIDTWRLPITLEVRRAPVKQDPSPRLDVVEGWTTLDHMWDQACRDGHHLTMDEMNNFQADELAAQERILGLGGGVHHDQASASRMVVARIVATMRHHGFKYLFDDHGDKDENRRCVSRAEILPPR
jgi:hypothetical protein